MLRDPDSPFAAGGLSRRALLRGGAALVGGLLIGVELPPRPARADEPVPTGARFNAFIHVAPDDRVTFTMPAVEMGQGVYTSQAQCLAEELDIGLDKVVAAHAPPITAAPS
jgi:isoquinoline 1-oxidoreductase beta subunit